MRTRRDHSDGFLRPPSARLTQSSLLFTVGASLSLLVGAGLLMIVLSDPLMDRINDARGALCERNLISFCGR